MQYVTLNNFMYVCVCNAVTERDIQNCVEEGARSMRDLRLCLGVSSQCGKCARHARAMLKESKNGDAPGFLADANAAA